MMTTMSALLWALLWAQDPPKEDKPPAKQDTPAPPKEEPKQDKPAKELSPAAQEAAESLKKVESRIPEFKGFEKRMEEIKNEFIAARMAGDKDKGTRLMAEYQSLTEKAQKLQGELMKALQDLVAKAGEDLKKTPDDIDLIDTRASVLLMLGETDKALPDARRVTELAPDRLEAGLRYARLLYYSNQYEAAVKAADVVLARDKDNVEPQLIRGISLFGLNRFEEAVQALEIVQKSTSKKTPEESSTADEFLKLSREHIELFKKENEIRALEAKADDLPRVKLTTSRGVVVAELFENEAPNTVANFISLAEKKFFDGTKFHRVIPNFMIQGGDPNSKDNDPSNDGMGGPGYSFEDELPEGKYRRHFRGALSMANSGPHTNGSQFFVTHLPAHWLNGRHVVFGRVLEGQDVIDQIRMGDVLEKVEVLRRRPHEYKPVVKADPKEVPPEPPPKEEPKKEEPKKDEPPKNEPKKDEPKKDGPPKEEPKKDAPPPK